MKNGTTIVVKNWAINDAIAAPEAPNTGIKQMLSITLLKAAAAYT